MGRFRELLLKLRIFQKRESLGHTFAWQGFQLLGLLLFMVYLAMMQGTVKRLLISDQDTLIESLVSQFLDQGLWPFLPNGFWLLVWPLLLVTLALLVFTTWRWWFLGIVGAASCLLLIADRIYYTFFDSVLPISSIGATGQLWRVKQSVLASFQGSDLLWLLGCLLFPLWGWFIHLAISPKLGENKVYFLGDKLFGILCLVFTFHAATQAFYLPSKHVVIENQYSLKVFDDRSQAKSMNFTVPYQSSYRSFAAVFGVFNFHLYNLAEFFDTKLENHSLEEPTLEKVATFLNGRQALNDIPSPLMGEAKGRNVIVISLESFASALVGLEVGGKQVTPTLNRLVAENLYWPKIVDNARTGGTSDAEFSVLTGLMTDLRRMAAMGIAEKTDLLGLPRTLKQAGYQTYSFHGNEASFWNRNVNHPRLGIDEMKFEDSYDDAVSLGIGIPDHVVFPKVWEYLQAGTQPFFGFVISLSSHHPFPDIEDSYHDLNLDGVPDGPFQRYLKLANYTDRALAEFIEIAKAKGLWENTLLVLYGDHRPPFADHDLAQFEQMCGVPLSKGRGLQIPVVAILPGLEDQMASLQEEVRATVGGLQDIYPTIMHLLGIPVPYGIYGTHLLVPNSQRAPLPLFKLSSSYVYDGVVYTGPYGNPVSDSLGLLFTKHRNTLITDSQRKQALFKQATEALEMHLYFFNQNAQRDAIALREKRSKASQ